MKSLILTGILIFCLNSAFAANNSDFQGSLKIRVIPSSQCSWGSLDLIHHELREHKSKGSAADMLISLESMDGEFQETFKLNDFIEKKLKQEEFRFIVPTEVARKKYFALYICKSSTGNNSCGILKAKTLDSILDHHSVAFDDKGKYTQDKRKQDFLALPEDSIYFYRPIQLDNNSLNIFPEQFTVDSLKTLKQEIVGSGLVTSEKAEFASDAIINIKSNPLNIKEGYVEAKLSFADQVKCSGLKEEKAN